MFVFFYLELKMEIKNNLVNTRKYKKSIILNKKMKKKALRVNLKNIVIQYMTFITHYFHWKKTIMKIVKMVASHGWGVTEKQKTKI